MNIKIPVRRHYRIEELLLALCIIAVSVIFQVHCATHGFDLTDEGYLMSIYQWFGTDSHYAQGAGGYPLTGYLGWFINKTFPDGGILGMRLWGIALVTITELLLYVYLRQYFNPKMVLLGLLLQSVFVAQDPKPFGYNTLTALFAALSFILLIEGTIRRWWWLLVGGGMLLGINVFVRIPNITGAAFLLIPYFFNTASKKDLQLKKSTLQALQIAIGFLIGAVAAWFFLVSIGADKLVIDLVTSLGDTLGGKSTHGSGTMLAKYMENLVYSILLFVIFVIALLVGATTRLTRYWLVRLLIWFGVFQIIYRLTYINSSMLGDTLAGLLNGIGIFGSCCYLLQGKTLRSIALSAILFSLVLPLGSDGGYETMWVGTWLSLPIGLSGIYAVVSKAVREHWKVDFLLTGARKMHIVFSVPKSLLSSFLICMFSLGLATVAKVENHAYYDPGHKSEKNYAIVSPLAQGLFTSEARTLVINPLLEELPKYVQPGDELLVYDSSPMICYLMCAKPFGGISWPCLFYGQQYVKKLRQAEQEANTLPVVVMQFFWSSNKWSESNPLFYEQVKDSPFSTTEMTEEMMRFLKAHHYRVVWTNNYYKILVPGETTK